MSNLMRIARHPVLRSDFNPFADDFFRPFFNNAAPEQFGLRVDVKDEGAQYLLEADLPGIKKENVSIEVEDGVLTISAQMNENKREERANYLYNERRVGKFQRSFTLNGIQEDAISATCEDGVLKLTLPKMNEEPKPMGRRIEIN